MAIIVLPTSLFAQNFSLPSKPFFGTDIEPFVSLNANYSTILNRNVAFTGVGLGIAWNSGLMASINYYYLSSQVNTNKYTEDNKPWRLYLRYTVFTPSIDFFEYENLIASAETGLGIGRIIRKENDIFRARNLIFLVEPAVRLKYSILNWLYIYGMVGYRSTIPTGMYNASAFSSSKFDIGISISPFALYKSYKDGTLFKEDNGQ